MNVPFLPKDKKRWLLFLKNNALVILGTLVLAFGTGFFLIPFDLVTGGVSGLGIVLAHLLSPIALLSGIGADVYASILVWIFFIIGFFTLGRSFAAKTLVSTLVYPFALSLATSLVDSNFLSGFFNLASDRYLAYSGMSVVLAAVFGGALVGAGCALTFLGGGSTGGVDIIALTLTKYCPKIKNSLAMFVTDATIVILGVLIIQNLILTLLGIVSAFVCALAIDKLFVGENDAFIAHVISSRTDEINDAVIQRLNRTTTILPCQGGYTRREQKMLMITFSIKQYADFMALIASIDKAAFVTLHRAREIHGEGWTYQLPYGTEPNTQSAAIKTADITTADSPVSVDVPDETAS